MLTGSQTAAAVLASSKHLAASRLQTSWQQLDDDRQQQEHGSHVMPQQVLDGLGQPAGRRECVINLECSAIRVNALTDSSSWQYSWHQLEGDRQQQVHGSLDRIDEGASRLLKVSQQHP